MSQLEGDHAHHASTGGSLMCWGLVPGPVQTSYRAELLGLLAMAMAPGATRGYLDNQSVVKGFAALRAASIDLRRRPWGLRKDGDLWCALDHLCHARGAALP